MGSSLRPSISSNSWMPPLPASVVTVCAPGDERGEGVADSYVMSNPSAISSLPGEGEFMYVFSIPYPVAAGQFIRSRLLRIAVRYYPEVDGYLCWRLMTSMLETMISSVS
jgi:hypothetical protein